MKYLLFLAVAWMGLGPSVHSTKNMLIGTVKDANTGEPLVGAKIEALQKMQSVAIVQTDINGKFSLELAPGAFDVQCSYTGYEGQRILGVSVAEGKENTLDFALSPGAGLDEIVVLGYGSPASRAKTLTGSMKTADSGRVAAEAPASFSAPAPPLSTTPGATSIDGGAVEISGSRAPATAYYVYGVHVAGEAKSAPKPAKPASTAAKKSKADAKPAPPATKKEREKVRFKEPVIAKDEEIADDLIAEMAAPPGGGEPAPRAGLLTGGEWNDLHNWQKHWADLLADGEIAAHMNTYKFYPKHRFSVLLENENGFPAPDFDVRLLAPDGSIAWQSRTDNRGRAELWAGLFDDKKLGNLRLEARFGAKTLDLGAAKPFSEGINRHKINFQCAAPKTADIVWAVDATGSMGDEIEYLKTELLDVIGRVKAGNPQLHLRMGTVFYKDKTDDYIVKGSNLNYDIEKTVNFIKQQYAGGGGDYPEAVHSALEEAIFRQSWSSEAVARICFLVLDASPHQEPGVVESLQRSIREAARRGIRIVPLAASGIQKDTEFLMKFFGLATNGTYTFLTDHSGIGGKHLEATTDEYKVESVNDLLVRLITEYTSVPSCEGKSEIRFEDPQNGQGTGWQAVYFPNPASDQFTLELPVEVQTLTIYNSEGQAVRKLTGLKAGQTSVPVADLPEGFYTIRILKDNQMQSGKLMVVRS